MIRSTVFRIKPFSILPKTVLLSALFLMPAFTAACGGATQNSAPDTSAASSSGAAAPAFEGAITARLFPGAEPVEIKYAIKGSRSRIETQLSRGSSQMGVMLMDLSSETQTMLIPQAKTYMTMNLREMAEKMTEGAEKDSAGDFPKVTSTGKTETIAGYTCKHWLIGDEQNTDVCMAKGLGYFGGGQSGGIFDQLKNLALSAKIKAQIAANPEFAKFVEGGAFPLKMEQIKNGQSKTIMEVISVEKKSLDDSLFTVPADYKKMEMPRMPGIPANK